MLFPSWIPQQQQKEQQLLQPKSPSASSNRSPSPLDIPEILHLIFSYIDRYTITRTIILVCRQWLLLNKNHLRRDLVWDILWQPFLEPDHVLSCLEGADRLILGCWHDGSNWRGPDLIAALLSIRKRNRGRLMSTLLAPFTWYQNNKQPSYITQLWSRPLREVVFSSSENFSRYRLDLLPFPRTLQRLRIDRYDVISYDIAVVLSAYPLLESLHLSSTHALLLKGPQMDELKKGLPRRLALRSLVLRKPFVAQAWLEDLLTVTPGLEELQLATVFVSADAPWTWNWPQLRDHLKKLSLPLKCFHLSMNQTSTTNDNRELEILDICPTAREITMAPCSLSPRLAEYFQERQIALTKLDILRNHSGIQCAQYGWQTNDLTTSIVAFSWHYLLCKSPSLRHLKTLKMPYMTDYMDLHRRCYVSGDSFALPVSGVWACRGLERLHLDLHIHEHATARGSHNTRIVYGYISRVCPNLQHLRIRFPTLCKFPNGFVNWRQHPFVLEGGLCLLSRLERLECLKVVFGTVECEIAELNWLCRSGRNEEHKARRRQLVEGWTWRLEQEAKLDADRLLTVLGRARPLLNMMTSDEELVASLANLGLLQDVKDVLAEMDKNNYECLPSLRLLACGNHYPQSPEKELRSLFYVEPPGVLEYLSSINPF